MNASFVTLIELELLNMPLTYYEKQDKQFNLLDIGDANQ